MRVYRIIFIAALLFLFPAESYSLLDKSRTGGMSEIYLGQTVLNVEGGFIEWHEKGNISIRANAIEISLDIDNSVSKDDREFNIVVNNVNPEMTKIIGWGDGEIKKGKNSLSFSVMVKGKKVAVYKLIPELKDDEFNFIVFGESKGGHQVFERIISDIDYRKPLFAISCGDMLENASPGEFKRFLDEVDNVTVPFMTVAGSTEIDKGSRRLYEDYLGNPYHSFDFKNSHFIILDNGDNRMSDEQFTWLENDLRQNKAINTFVFMHVSPFDPRPGRKQPMKLGEQFIRLSSLLERYKVTRVFTSGIHGYFREERAGTPYIITGGGGSELVSTDSFYNYIIVEVKGDKVKDKLIKLTSPSLGWYDASKLKVRLYLKNSFETSPIRSSFYLAGSLIFIILVTRGILRKLSVSKRNKKRISF